MIKTGLEFYFFSHFPSNWQNDKYIEDLIPPPPPTLKRNLSLNKSHQQINIPTILGNQNANDEYNPNTFELSSNKPDLFNFTTTAAKAEHHNKLIGDSISPNTIQTTDINNPSKKVTYPLYYFDDGNYHPNCEKENINSLYLYHHEPMTYLPNYDNISAANKLADKYNTIDCSGVPAPIHYNNSNTMTTPHNKFHASTCNLNSQFNSSNLNNGHHFSNSLNNFNLINPHHQMPNFYNFNPSYNQLQTQLTPEGMTNLGGMPGAYGSSSIMGSSFASNISLNGTPKNSQNMPWKHRQCSSRGSSSSGTNSSSKSWEIFANFFILRIWQILRIQCKMIHIIQIISRKENFVKVKHVESNIFIRIWVFASQFE